jgi:SagB-type dehydrogenase family enzyme
MSVAIAYHEATKYRPATIGEHPGMDWSRQPLPWKRYSTDVPVELAPFLPIDPNPFTGGDAGAEAAVANDASITALVARWLYFTYGITAVVGGQPRPMHLRAAPSAGGLYPTELYLVAHQAGDLADGLYGFDPVRHIAVPLWPGPEAHAALVEAAYGSAAVAGADLTLIATGVFERSRWRYRERGYRRVLLDTGHLLGNAVLAAHALGRRAHLTTAFCDEAVERLLRIDPATPVGDHPSDEGVLALVALPRAGAPERPSWTALPAPTGSADAAPPLTNALHLAGRLPVQRPRPAPRGDDLADGPERQHGWVGGQSLRPADPAPAALAVGPLASILHRRSTRQFAPLPITRGQLAEILLCGDDPAACACGPAGGIDRSQLMTFVAVNAVDGLASGVHYLVPGTLELREVRLMTEERSREVCRFLCLGQDLGGDAAAVVIHAADLRAAVRLMGDRVYRSLHLDAGIIGQRLNLAALALGLGASGIGGFFDEQISDVLGLPRDMAVVYVTTIGAPAR